MAAPSAQSAERSGRSAELKRPLTMPAFESMDVDQLRQYAATASQRITYLEDRVASCESELRQKESQRLQQSRRFLESASSRDRELREALDQAQRELSAERLMRKDIQESTENMRLLCRTAKERLESVLRERDALLKDLAERDQRIETLMDQVFDLRLCCDELADRCQRCESELVRERKRQAELEAYLHRGEHLRALHVVKELFEAICQRVLVSSADPPLSLPPHARTASVPSVFPPSPPYDDCSTQPLGKHCQEKKEDTSTTFQHRQTASHLTNMFAQLVSDTICCPKGLPSPPPLLNLRHLSNLTPTRSDLDDTASTISGGPSTNTVGTTTTCGSGIQSLKSSSDSGDLCSRVQPEDSDIEFDCPSSRVSASSPPRKRTRHHPRLVKTSSSKKAVESKSLTALRKRLGPPPSRLRVSDS